MEKTAIKSPIHNKSYMWIVASAVLAVMLVFALVVSVNYFQQKRLFDINDISVQTKGSTITDELITEIGSKDIVLELKINTDINQAKYAKPSIIWEFVENNLNCSITDGVLKIGDTIGSTKIKVNAKSKNEKSFEFVLKIVEKSDSVLSEIYVDTGTPVVNYIEGQQFSKDDYTIYADYGDYQAKVVDYTSNIEIFELKDTMVEISYKDKIIQLPVVVNAKTLQAIEVVENLTKTEYIEGESFDIDGLKVVAVYEYITVELTQFDMNINDGAVVSLTDNNLIISYTETVNQINITKTATVELIVNPKVLIRIETDVSSVKLNYYQGQKFDKTGLVVTAYYNNGLHENIEDYTVKLTRADDRLLASDEVVIIEYLEQKSEISIVVDKPYTEIREIVVKGKFEVTLSWVYNFVTDDGIIKIERNAYMPENSEYLDRELIYNESHPTDATWAIYEVPVGATVTVYAQNLAILDFLFDGVEQKMVHPARSVDFVLDSADVALEISTKKLSDRRTIIFTDNNSTIALSYPIVWNGLLREKDLEHIAFIFDEASSIYENIYLIEGSERNFVQLSELIETSLVYLVIEVKKVEKVNEIAITVEYWEDFTITVFVDIADYTNNEWMDKLPLITRVGYEFSEWNMISDTMVKAVWIRDSQIYTNDFVGSWYVSGIDGESLLECEITLNSDGSYTYVTLIDSVVNISITGIYSYDEETNSLIVLSIDSEEELLIVSYDDFGFSFEDLLTANVLIVNEYELVQYDAVFAKK